MQKDFQTWTNVKTQAHAHDEQLPFRERDVWWCKLGANIGDEQDGKGNLFLRPILVVRKFNKRVFIGLPFSTKVKENNYFYHKFEFKGRDQSVIISQIRLLDAKRLSHKLGAVNEADFAEIKEKTKNLIFKN